MKAARKLLAILATAFVIVGTSRAQSGITPLGTMFNFWHEANDVVLVENYAYVATGISGLRVVDVRDPQNPVEVGKYDDFDEAVDHLYLVNGLIYATNYNSATILDISARTTPQLVGHGRIWCLDGATAIGGSTMLAVGNALWDFNGSWLVRHDLTDPSNPRANDTLALPGIQVNSIAIQGETAYLTIYQDSLFTVDLSDPQRMQLLDHIRTGGAACKVVVNGEVAYVMSGGRGLEVVSILNPSDLSIRTRVNVRGDCNDTRLIGNHLFVSSQSGVECVSVIDPFLPVLVSQIGNRRNTCSVDANWPLFVAANGTEGITTYDFSDPEHPDSLGSFQSPGVVSEVVLRDGIAYVASCQNGLNIVDASNPQRPRLLSNMQFPGWVTRVSIEGDHAFVAGPSNGIQIIDISNPDAPDLISTYSSPHYAYGYAVKSGNILYAAGNSLEALDISNLAVPRLRSSCSLSVPIQNFVIEGNYAYVVGKVDALDFAIVDLSNPDSLREIYHDSLYQDDMPAPPTDIIVDDGIAYILYRRGVLIVLDVTDPMSPRELARIADYRFSFARFSKRGSCLIMATRYSGLQVCNVSDPTEPQFVGSIEDCFFMEWVSMEGNIAAVAQYASLRFYDISNALSIPSGEGVTPSTARLLSVYPNPFNSSATIKINMPSTAPLQLVLFDMNGREWDSWELPASKLTRESRFMLDGNRLPSGSFYLQAVGGGKTFSAPIVHIK